MICLSRTNLIGFWKITKQDNNLRTNCRLNKTTMYPMSLTIRFHSSLPSATIKLSTFLSKIQRMRSCKTEMKCFHLISHRTTLLLLQTSRQIRQSNFLDEKSIKIWSHLRSVEWRILLLLVKIACYAHLVFKSWENQLATNWRHCCVLVADAEMMMRQSTSWRKKAENTWSTWLTSRGLKV